MASPSLPLWETLGAAVLNGTVISRLLGLWIAYRLLLALYNISPFHPLHKFPGPRLAAASFIYEFWYDFILYGRYSHEIRRMHEIYGPIVRINPEELHCNDASFVNEIYPVGGRIRDKHQHYLNMNVGPVTITAFGSRFHEIHRLRRDALNRFFSKAQMLKLEPKVRQLVQQLCDKMLAWTDKPIDLAEAYNCLTGDTISSYAFGGAPWLPQQPRGLGELMRELYVTIPGYVRAARRNPKAGTIFTDLLDSDLPPAEKTEARLAADGFSLTGAGAETTANMLTCATFFLLSHPDKRARLEQELARAGVDPEGRELSWAALEQIPYLYGFVQETLRMAHGLSSRLARVARAEDLIYRGESGKITEGFEYVIPRGTPIGMSAFITHRDAGVFPDPEEFRPERWVTVEGEKNTALDKYLLSFSKGSRICLGMNLAMCELYLTIAAIVLRVAPQMKLLNENDDAIKWDYEVMIPKPKKGTKPVSVVISPK
ncbi:hypothetical protein PG990_001090 [Apiospora arundinis]